MHAFAWVDLQNLFKTLMHTDCWGYRKPLLFMHTSVLKAGACSSGVTEIVSDLWQESKDGPSVWQAQVRSFKGHWNDHVTREKSQWSVCFIINQTPFVPTDSEVWINLDYINIGIFSPRIYFVSVFHFMTTTINILLVML